MNAQRSHDEDDPIVLSKEAGGNYWRSPVTLAYQLADRMMEERKSKEAKSAARFGKELNGAEWLVQLAIERADEGFHEDAVNLEAVSRWMLDAQAKGYEFRPIDPLTGEFKEGSADA